jgi:hypothetical protein
MYIQNRGHGYAPFWRDAHVVKDGLDTPDLVLDQVHALCVVHDV